jgi:peroxin-1
MHPLTRLQLQIALCCDLVLIKMLSPLEAEQMNATLLNVCQRNVAEVCLERVVVDRQHLLPPWRYPVLFIQSNDDTTGSTSWSGLIESLEDLGDLPITLGVVLQLPRPDDINSYPLTGNFYRLVLQGAEDTRVSLANSFIRAQDAVLLLRQRVHYRHVSIGPSIAHDESLLIPNHSGGEWCVSELLSKLKASRARRSVLISGGTGSGKTLAAMVVASRMQVSFQCNISYLDCRRLKDGRGFQLSRIMLELDTLVGSLVQSSRAILILDDLDDIIPFCGVDVNEKGSEHAQQPNSLMKDQCLAIESTLCKLIRVANECGCQMLFVVTCSDPQCISSQVMSSLAIDSKLNLPLLSSNDRIKLFCSALRQSCASSLVTEMELVGLDKATAGYRPRDFERLALRIKQLSVTDVEESFAAVAREVLNEYVPLSKLSAVTANSKLSYGWNEVGGLFDAKEELIATILRPSKYSRIYENAHIRLPRGVLMFGESGCGKSFLVPAFAAKCGFPLITCRGPELLDKYIGASEAKIRELFSRAASVAPSILFLDELDSLAPRRGYDSTGVTDRIVNQLLTFLDGVEETSISGSVYIIAATSRPDKVDPALLRPGRLERHVYVGLPKDEEEWRDLFINTSRRYDTDDDVIQFVSSSGSFARGQENYTLALSAAELSSVFNTAQVAAAHEALSAESNPSKVFLKLRHIKHAIQTTKPSMSKADGVRLRRIYAAFRKDRAVGDIHKSPDMDTANLLRTALK